jgi:hypothetical protein
MFRTALEVAEEASLLMDQTYFKLQQLEVEVNAITPVLLLYTLTLMEKLQPTVETTLQVHSLEEQQETAVAKVNGAELLVLEEVPVGQHKVEDHTVVWDLQDLG